MGFEIELVGVVLLALSTLMVLDLIDLLDSLVEELVSVFLSFGELSLILKLEELFSVLFLVEGSFGFDVFQSLL